jgi:hypothetical protein
MKILAIGHRQYMGKDTLARFITSELRNQTRKLGVENRSFAFKLKEVCYSLYAWAGLFGPDYYELHSNKKNEKLPLINKTPREIWIEVGQHMRKYDNDVFINSVLKNNPPEVLIIRDLRFPHEAEKIRELKGILIKLTRENQELSNDEADIALENWTDWDYQITANSLTDLHNHAAIIVNSYCSEFLRVY